MDRIVRLMAPALAPIALIAGAGSAIAAPSPVDNPPPVKIVSGASHATVSTPPAAGQHVRLTVRGRARGGRYLVTHEIRFGDGDIYHGPIARCMVIKHPPTLHRDPFRSVIGHTWPKAGTYHVRYTLAALCEPHVPIRTVRVTVHVTTG